MPIEVTSAELFAVSKAHARAASARRSSSGGGGGGGCSEQQIIQRESGGNYQAQNPSSTASGAYQILDSTWAGRYGLASASDATPAQQQQAYTEIRASNPRAWAASGC